MNSSHFILQKLNILNSLRQEKSCISAKEYKLELYFNTLNASFHTCSIVYNACYINIPHLNIPINFSEKGNLELFAALQSK